MLLLWTIDAYILNDILWVSLIFALSLALSLNETNSRSYLTDLIRK